MVAAVLSVMIGVLQTEWFVTMLNHPTAAQVQQSIQEDDAEQQKIRRQYEQTGKACITGIVFHERFEQSARDMLNRALTELKANHELQKTLKNDFGKTFDDVDAVIFPAWQTNHHKAVYGFTEIGLAAARSASAQLFAAGFTIRDRRNKPQVTEDGVPRIGIDLEAFEDNETLKVTLFHELLHAMNVPKHEPPWYTFSLLQNDLAYCDEYRDCIHRFSFKNDREWLVRIGILLPFLALGYLAMRHVRCVWRRRHHT